jgi:hypothetical protein
LGEHQILLPKDYDRNLDYELRLYLCDENEELVCYLAPFKLLCDHECAYDTTIQNLSCEKFENGNMIFPFDWSIDLNGYTLCENGLTGYLNNGGIVNVISSEINGTKLDFIINLSMPDNTDLLQDFELRLYLCDEFGNSSCFLIPLSLSCGEEACNIIDENVTINCIREYRGYYIFNYSNLLQLPSNYQLCNGFLQTSIDGNGLIQGQLDS